MRCIDQMGSVLPFVPQGCRKRKGFSAGKRATPAPILPSTTPQSSNVDTFSRITKRNCQLTKKEALPASWKNSVTNKTFPTNILIHTEDYTRGKQARQSQSVGLRSPGTSRAMPRVANYPGAADLTLSEPGACVLPSDVSRSPWCAVPSLPRTA